MRVLDGALSLKMWVLSITINPAGMSERQR
jgi:hypothetical protein